jgi:hypothetical protein
MERGRREAMDFGYKEQEKKCKHVQFSSAEAMITGSKNSPPCLTPSPSD